MRLWKLRELIKDLPDNYEVVINADILNEDFYLNEAYVMETLSGTDSREHAVLCDEKMGLIYISAQIRLDKDRRPMR